jgi:lysophospholipase L1-like esterase
MPSSVNDTTASWFERHPKTTLASVLIVFLILLEILLRILAAQGVFPYQRHPTSFKPVFWDDIHPIVGVWRHPDATLRHTSACFDVTYSSNAYGMRDAPRTKSSTALRRVVVLGDSFTEGFGVARAQRFTNRLEAQTGVEHLNFGSGGGFGSIQQWLIYEHLAADFDHSDVFIFMLPCNDFLDNNPDAYPADRYRPYLKKAGGGFKLYYTVDFSERRMEFRSPFETLKNIFDNTVYTANFLRWGVAEIQLATGLKQALPAVDATAYYDRYATEDIEILLYTYRRILRTAGTRRVYLFTIPIEADFNAARRNGYRFQLVSVLERFAEAHDNLYYRDLLVDFLGHSERHGIPYRAYTLGCDPHWGPLGHRVAADAVRRIAFE